MQVRHGTLQKFQHLRCHESHLRQERSHPRPACGHALGHPTIGGALHHESAVADRFAAKLIEPAEEWDHLQQLDRRVYRASASESFELPSHLHDLRGKIKLQGFKQDIDVLWRLR